MRSGNSPRLLAGRKYWTYIASTRYVPLRSTFAGTPPGVNTTSFTGLPLIVTSRPPTWNEPMSRSAIGDWLAQPASSRAQRMAREGMEAPLELVAAQSAVDRDHGAGDVARPRRGEEAHQVGDVLGLAVFADRDVLAALALAELGRVVAQDLLGDDAAGRHAVHRDAEFADFARQPFCPGVQRRLGGKGAVQPFGLRFA